MKRLLILVSFLLLLAAHSSAQQSSPPSSLGLYFVDGNVYMGWNPVMRAGYVSGFVDTLLLAEAFGLSDRQWLQSCVRDRHVTIGQFTDVVTKLIRDHPERRDERLALLAYNAIGAMCVPSSVPIPRY